MKRKNYKAVTTLMIGTLLTVGTIAACGSQSEAAPTQAITSSQELMASGAKSASVPVETTPQTAAGNTGASKAAPAPASTAGTASRTTASKDIGEAAAKQIALSHAGIAETDASHLWVNRDYDDGRLEYEVEFFSGSKEYDYDIDAADGTILSFDSETEFAGKKTDNTASGQAASSTAQAAGEGISIEQAKKIALAKVPGADDSHIRIEKDRDDGQILYDGKIVYGGVEYEFEISAADGSVLDWEIDD